MSFRPAKLLGIDKGSLAEGKCADVVLIDPDKEWTVRREELVSKGKNTPFDGRKLRGAVVMTIVDGEIVYTDMEEK